ncbi:MAG: NAD(P)H-dependent oxidoreductase [Verrucomicrobiae bacterium]|nr:NAD(P)H-dependent oxidoreductase [Verrucomicrobiae bacterium]
MSEPLKLLAFAGSTRKDSYNQAVLNVVSDAAEAAGAIVDRVSLADFPMPLFDQDLESRDGLPPTTIELKKRMTAADGLLIASPEYNSAFSPLMKNTIDWVSRAETDDEPPLSAYRGKSTLLVAASPGGLGGIRGLYALRSVFQNIGVTVYPSMLAIGSAYQLVDDNGVLTDEKWRQRLASLAKEYVDFAGKLKG